MRVARARTHTHAHTPTRSCLHLQQQDELMPVKGCGGGASQVCAALQILTSVIHSSQRDKEGEGEKKNLLKAGLKTLLNKSAVEQERSH